MLSDREMETIEVLFLAQENIQWHPLIELLSVIRIRMVSCPHDNCTVRTL